VTVIRIILCFFDLLLAKISSTTIRKPIRAPDFPKHMRPVGFFVIAIFVLSFTSRLEIATGISVRELHLLTRMGKFAPNMDGERCELICCECEKPQPIESEITEGFLKRRKQTFKPQVEDEPAVGELKPKKFEAPKETEDNNTIGEIMPRKLKVQLEKEEEVAVGEILPAQHRVELKLEEGPEGGEILPRKPSTQTPVRKEMPPPGEIKPRHFDMPPPELAIDLSVVGELAPKKIKLELTEDEPSQPGILKPREMTANIIDGDSRPISGELKGKSQLLVPKRYMVMGKLDPCANACKEYEGGED